MGFVLGAGAALSAFLIGLLPVLVWLAFWLLEDWKKPEPRGLLLLAFLGGMLAVLISLPFEAFVESVTPPGFLLILLWAAIEELAILGVAWVTVLKRSAADEPIDMPVYLITTALGFSALENAFFLFGPLMTGRFLDGLVTGDLRFIGATLMHVLSASVIGGALAFVFYRERADKLVIGTAGVILAILLHATFNSLIISSSSGSILMVFMGVWVGIVFLLLGLERVKAIQRPAWWEKMFMKRNP